MPSVHLIGGPLDGQVTAIPGPLPPLLRFPQYSDSGSPGETVILIYRWRLHSAATYDYVEAEAIR